jgi:hypothetical protein
MRSKNLDATEICEQLAGELQNFMSVHLGGAEESQLK